ncbi:hypothetical protein HHK36_028893 [Tetracentron sinense]|uniref:TFA2 Winged helix domain-containing protein n=1 Tax=Tetracentron sinense TaxID=13715 RepID=A0A834YGM9_TETSI|nr:hypothetical protein HHK36_028893 [Tetracentron sinense]
MALRESLAKFKQQQEKCQSTLISITSRTGSSRATQPQKATPSSAASSAPAVKFSNDTERLQHINSIRKSPIGAQIKRVIDLLLETRQALTPEQINEACYVDVNANKAVFDIQAFDLKDKNQLLVLIRKFPEGIAVFDFKDAYPTVMEDLQALKAVGQLWLLLNFDSQEDIAYPNDPRVPVKVDDDLKLLFRGIELPRDMIDIEKDIQKNGMKPATNTAKRRAMAQVHGITPKPKKKQCELSKRTKLTNAHLPELFQNLNVPST